MYINCIAWLCFQPADDCEENDAVDLAAGKTRGDRMREGPPKTAEFDERTEEWVQDTVPPLEWESELGERVRVAMEANVDWWVERMLERNPFVRDLFQAAFGEVVRDEDGEVEEKEGEELP